MKLKRSYPGVYIEEVPTHAHPIAGAWQPDTKEMATLGTIVARVRRGPLQGVVLFSGRDGEARTSAARFLAGKLRLPLYRIELSAIVSKYIGETEKNLSAIFNLAEKSGAVLFFDEADALFGKRSKVKDSHDRYANAAANYLLQRIEAYEGATILATDTKQSLGAACLRRVQFDLSFPLRGRTKAAK